MLRGRKEIRGEWRKIKADGRGSNKWEKKLEGEGIKEEGWEGIGPVMGEEQVSGRGSSRARGGFFL